MPLNADRLKAAFLGALDQSSAAERTAFLDKAYGNNATLRRDVEALLRAHDQADPLLDRPATEHLDGLSNERAGAEDSLGFLAPPTRPDSLGRLGHYEMLQVLGRGGFGIVLRAFDEALHRVVVVKVLAPQLAVSSPPRKRFLREARSAARVRHENVVQVYAVEEQPLPYLVMEFIPGETLQQRLDRTGPLDVTEVLQIGRQIAEGLAAAHGTGLIHRDVKPSNILIEAGPHRRVKITDFGLARAMDDASLTQSGVIAGTPMYMAPEQASGEPLDHRADLFSLGSVLYAMCTGRPPFRAKSALAVLRRVAEDTPRPIPELTPEVPQWLCDIISKLHAKKREGRFESAQEVADLLARHTTEAQRGGDGEAPQAAASATRPRWRGRRWMAAAGFLMLLGGLSFAEAAGVTDVRGTVIRLFSPEGTLVVEVDDPGVSIKIDGSELVITGAGPREIRLKPGRYTVETSKGGKVVRQELVTVTKNGRRVVRVSQEPAPTDAQPAKVTPEAAARERAVAGLPAAEAVKFVAARMRGLNPGFDGAVVPTIENGAVTGLEFKTDRVSDISPVRALTKLRSLTCRADVTFKGQLSDLSPLRGLPLTHLDCVNNPVWDLSPLKGMKLIRLYCDSTRVSDLSPLKGMRLEDLGCGYTKVADLAPLEGMRLTRAQFDETEVSDLRPLKGMPLTHLSIGRGVTDLSPLAGMPLLELGCGRSKVSDLSPLRGMPIWLLTIDGTKVSDLTPLQGMVTLKRLACSDEVANLSPLKGLSLEYLCAGPLVTDLSPLKGMPLDTIGFRTFKAERDAKVLRAIPTLKTINDKPADEFWKAIDAKAKARE